MIRTRRQSKGNSNGLSKSIGRIRRAFRASIALGVVIIVIVPLDISGWLTALVDYSL